MEIEEGFQMAKTCGRFQVIMQFVAIYVVMTTGYQGLFSYFIFDSPPWQCTRYSNSSFCIKNFKKIFSNDNDEFGERCMLKRYEWSYTTSKTYSAVTEFDLVCSKTTLAATASSALYTGGLVGAALAGKLADLYGRKPVLILTLLAGFAASIGCAFVTNIWQLTGLRGFLGACYVSYFTITLVFLMEYVSPKYRTMAGILYNTTFCFSLIVTDIFAYHERKWRDLQMYTSLPSILALIVFCFLPESPRWLLATGQTEKAQHNLKKVGKFNGKHMSSLTLRTQSSVKKKYGYLHLFKYRKVALITISQGCLWMTSATVYYALGLESSSLGGDMYHVFAYTALAEIPSNVLSIYSCDRLGRKKTILGSLLLAGIFTGLISIHLRSVKARFIFKVTLAVIARFFITISYNSAYVWAFEVFPTVVRSQGLCVCAIFERIGGILAPYLVRVLQRISMVLPFIIMCLLAIFTMLFGLVQPETNKLPTRESFDDFFENNSDSNSACADDAENGMGNAENNSERINIGKDNNVYDD